MKQSIDSRQLRAFVTLSQTGSFTLAARKLFLSQSAISHSMRSLEEDIGCRLLDRLGKRVVLTQAGEQLLHHAEKIMAEMGAARASLHQLGKWGRGRLRIGASTTACQYILPNVLREFKESFPQWMISIEPGDTSDSLESLSQNRTDLAILLEPAQKDGVEFYPLFEDELVFLLDPMHPWAVQGRVIREEIPKQNYVLYNKLSYTFRLVEKYFAQEDVVLNAVIELGSMEAIKEMVKLGLGVSILSEWIATKELQEGSLVKLPLGRRKLKRQWGIAHAKGRRLSLGEETFLGLCRSSTQDLVLNGS